MKDQSRDYTWKGLIWGAVLHVLLAVAPAIIILRCFFGVDYVPLIFGLTAMLICFVLQRKRHGALGERVRKRMVKFCRLFKANKKDNMPLNTEVYSKKKFNHNKELDKDAKLDEDVQNDMIILYAIMFWAVVTIIILSQILSFSEIEWRFSSIDLCKLLVCTILLLVVHEALHAFAAMVWGKVPWSSIHFGFKWLWGGSFCLYCHVDRPIKIGVYRIFVLFPLIVTTPIAGLILWLDPSIWALLFFGITIASCAGDVMVLFKMRRVENDKWVQDHQTEMGCYILPESKMDGD